MTEEQIKEMLKDIIDNGAEYEIYKQPCHIKKGNTKCIHTNLTCPECINKYSVKEKYKLGEEIHSDLEYRKVENWSVIEWEDTHKFEIRTLKDAEDIIGAFIQITFKTKEECEKWIEEHTKKSWLEERYPTEYEDIQTVSKRLAFREVAKEVCKKILKEVDNRFNHSTSVYSILEDIIKDLGIELEQNNGTDRD